MGANVGVLANRLIRATILDASVYEDVEADPIPGRQAALVVVLASVAAGIGVGGSQGASLRTFAVFTSIALATWLAWAWLVSEIGSRVLPEPQTATSFGELRRTLGFASTPDLRPSRCTRGRGSCLPPAAGSGSRAGRAPAVSSPSRCR